jgi:hypothetical protein
MMCTERLQVFRVERVLVLVPVMDVEAAAALSRGRLAGKDTRLVVTEEDESTNVPPGGRTVEGAREHRLSRP